MNYYQLTLEGVNGNVYYREVCDAEIDTYGILVGKKWHGFIVKNIEWIDPVEKERAYLEWLSS